MFGVVNEGGTAAAARLEGIEFCGKTGSAQVIGAHGLQRAGRGEPQLADNAWFVGFAPRRNPEIVVSVLVEQGEHGATVAAPIARDIIKAYYDKKNRRQQKQYTADDKHIELLKPLIAERETTSKPQAPPQGHPANSVER